MIDKYPGKEAALPTVVVGEALPGILSPQDLPEGAGFRDQTTDTNLGLLRFANEQSRDGNVRWESNRARVVAQAGSNLVMGIEEFSRIDRATAVLRRLPGLAR